MPRTSVLRKSGLARGRRIGPDRHRRTVGAGSAYVRTRRTRGYVDSTAHCAAPGTAVLFSATKTARWPSARPSGYQYAAYA